MQHTISASRLATLLSLGVILLATNLHSAQSAPMEEHEHHHEHSVEHPAGCTMDGSDHAEQKTPVPVARVKRQLVQAGPAAGQQQQPNLLGMLSELGPMVERAQSTMRLFSSGSNQNGGGLSSFPGLSGLSGVLPAGLTNPFQQASQEQQLKQSLERSLNSVGAAPATPSSNPLAQLEGLMGPLTAMVRSTQDSSAKAVAGAQQNIQQAGQQTATAAQNAQTGVLAALSDLGQGLRRIASNNPALGSDVKQLYASVSSKLAPGSSAGAQLPPALNPVAPKPTGGLQAPPLD